MKNYDEQIKLCDEKIAYYRAKKSKLKAEQAAEEHTKMLALLKENKISVSDLAEILAEHISIDNKITDKENTTNV